MGCCGTRKSLPDVRTEQKWDYINLDDFHSTSCWTSFSYGILYIALAISVAVYALDTFTAINLLAFDRWNGQIKPKIPLQYARWIFGGCIILSFVLLFFRWMRAVRVMKQGGVAQSYLDPLAVRVQSVRMGKRGRGWKRFLVFAELTKERKGASYAALFVYFSFEAWLRILLAEGPRQIINALTLYEVMNADLIPVGDNAAEDGSSPFAQFFINVRVLAEEQGRQQALVLFGMIFTLVVWVVTFINLMVAVLLYLFFLLHHVSKSDGSLSAYCRRKMNDSMESIVRNKVDKALRRENELREKEEAQQGGRTTRTRPTLPDMESLRSPNLPTLSRQTTQTSLGQFSARPGTAAGSTLTSPTSLERQNTSEFRPRPLARTDTHESSASWRSYDSNAPLVATAGGMGRGPPGQMGSHSSQPSLNRTYTSYSQSTQRSFTPGMGQGPAMPLNGRSALGIHRIDSQAASFTGGRQTPGYNASTVDPYGSRTPAEQNDPYFPASADYDINASRTMSHQSQSSGGGSMRAYTPGAPPPMRSITPSGSYGQPYSSAQPALPPLPTTTPFQPGGYRR